MDRRRTQNEIEMQLGQVDQRLSQLSDRRHQRLQKMNGRKHGLEQVIGLLGCAPDVGMPG